MIWRVGALLLVGLSLVGCQGPALPLAPMLYSQNAQAAFADVPPARQTTEIEILYATDRSVEHPGNGVITYGAGRSPSVAFGRVFVHLGEELTWDELVEASLDSRRRVPISVGYIEEIVRLPSTETPVVRINHQLVEDPAAVQSYLQSADVVHAELSRPMRQGAYGHSYFIDSPSVHSDVILILRDERRPGADHGPPLIKRDYGFWELRDGYPYLENDGGQVDVPQGVLSPTDVYPDSVEP